MIRFVPIVEGHGDVRAVPVLIRRIVAHEYPGARLEVSPPIRKPRDQLIRKEDVLERALKLAALRAGEDGAILLLIDADDDPPCQLGPALLKRVAEIVPHVDHAVVLAARDYECWFAAGVCSLAGTFGLADDLAPPPEPDAVHGKTWLKRQMRPEHAYSETVDQRELTRAFSLEEAKSRSPSFEKCWREVARLAALQQPAAG